MKKQLLVSAALVSVALAAQAGVVFEENWDGVFGTWDPSSIDATRWSIDEGVFGDGIYLSYPCDYELEAYGDGTFRTSVLNNTRGEQVAYWAGAAFISVPTFSASADSALVVEVDRISNAKGVIGKAVDTSYAARSAIWLIAPDKSKWLCVADNFGECGWGFNPYSGSGKDFPVNNPTHVGYVLDKINAMEGSNDPRTNIAIRLIANGTEARVFAKQNDVDGAAWVYTGKQIPLLFSENIAVGLGSYARTPGNIDEENGQTAEAMWGPLKVSNMGLFSFSRETIEQTTGKRASFTVTLSESATPATVTLTSSAPDVVKLVGSDGADLQVSFAKGETKKEIEYETLSEGNLSVISMAEQEEIIGFNTLTISVPNAAGVKLDEQFETFDETIWEIDEKGYEYAKYPAATASYDFMGVKDGKWMVENFKTVDQYWGGRGIITKKAFFGSESVPLRVTAVLDELTTPYAYEKEHAVCANLVLRNADSSRFFALRTTPGEKNWCYNSAIGASGTEILSGKTAGVGTMELYYDGKNIQAIVDGQVGATVAWNCDDALFVEIGFYGRAADSKLTRASFSSVKIQNESTPVVYSGSVSPSTIRISPNFQARVAVTLPEQAVLDGDVKVALSSSEPAVMSPAENELVFEKDTKELTKYVYLNAGQITGMSSSVTLSAVASNGTPLNDVTVKVYPEQELVFSDDFSGTTFSKAWEFVRDRQVGGGTVDTADFKIEEGTFVGYEKGGELAYGYSTMRLAESFTPTSYNPVIFQYDQGPVNGRGAIEVALATVEDLIGGQVAFFDRSIGDLMGWNYELSNTTVFNSNHRPTQLLTDELMDNGWHTVTILMTASDAYVYVDGIYAIALGITTSKATFGLGAGTRGLGTWMNFQFDNVKVFSNVSVISASAEEVLLEGDSGDFAILVPSAIRNAGVTVNVEIDNPDVVTFADGSVKKTLTVSGSSPYRSELGLKKVSAGYANIVISNENGYAIEKDVIPVSVMNTGDVLFFDEFMTDDGVLSSDWIIDTTPFEYTNPNGAGEMAYDTYYGLNMNFRLTENYWGGWMAKTVAGYVAGKLNPLTIIVPTQGLEYTGTGARRSFRLMNGDMSRWLDISESFDNGNHRYWGYNDSTINPTGGTGSYNITQAPEKYTAHVLKLVLDGEKVDVYIDDVFYKSIAFVMSQDIHFGIGVYARMAGDTVVSTAQSCKIIGSETLVPDLPVITRQPLSVKASAGTTAYFSVDATGENLHYAWYANGDVIAEGEGVTGIEVNAADKDLSVYVVVSNNAGSVRSTTATMTLVTPDPSDFEAAYVGPEAGALPGYYEYNAGTGEFKVFGCGSDVWGSSDHFYYLYQPVDGDFVLTARLLKYVNDSNQFGRTGLMVREGDENGSLYAGSRYIISQVYRQMEPTNANLRSQIRDLTDKDIQDAPASDFVTTWPHWQRIARTGDVYTLSYSADGEVWTEWSTIDTATWSEGALGSEKPLYVGLWNTSHNVNEIGYAVFDNVTLSNGEEPVEMTLNWFIDEATSDFVVYFDKGAGTLEASSDMSAWEPRETETMELGGKVVEFLKVAPSGGNAFFRLVK